MSWKANILDAFEVFGPASLFVLSFTEAIVQPIPPDVMYIPMLANAAGDVPLRGVVVVDGHRCIGRLVHSWVIGLVNGGELPHEAIWQEKHLTKLEHLTETYGTFGIFIAAFLLFRTRFWVGWRHGPHGEAAVHHGGVGWTRLRFGLEAVLIGLYGDQAIDAMMWFLTTKCSSPSS